jgi:hypothetical protein
MKLIVVAIIIFVCVFLFVARIYTTKEGKQDQPSGAEGDTPGEGADAEAGQ